MTREDPLGELRRNERMAYHNGRYVPESEVAIPLRDRGFLYGDAVFDTTRTFAHKAFRLKEHVARLYRSLAYVGIDPGISPAEMIAVSEEVLRRNRHLLADDEDCWLSQRVTRGLKQGAGIDADETGARVIVECLPLPLAERAVLYRDGIRVVTPAVRRVPPEAMSPRAKSHNYLNLVLAERQVDALDPGAWAVLLDTDGNLAEGLGSNISLVRAGELLTPRERQVLPGISRSMVMELAARLGIPVRELDLDLYDAATAEEAFLTSTSLCICPVTSINRRHVGPEGQVYGPTTRRLIDAYCQAVSCDFVGQYLRQLES